MFFCLFILTLPDVVVSLKIAQNSTTYLCLARLVNFIREFNLQLWRHIYIAQLTSTHKCNSGNAILYETPQALQM